MAYGQGEYASTSSVLQLVSFADDDHNGKALRDCHSAFNGCKAVFYARPNHLVSKPCSIAGSPDAAELAVASEAWFVHDTGYTDSAHRVYGKSGNSCMIYAMNPNAPGHQAWWLNYLRSHADNYDVVFFDTDPMRLINSYEFPSGGGCNPWPSVCTSTQEIATDADEVAARTNFASAMYHTNGSPMQIVFNKAYPPRTTSLDVLALESTNHFAAADCEDCVVEYGLYPNEYANTLDEMALVNTTPGAYVFMSQGNAPVGSSEQTAERLVTTAMVWLGYSEGHTVVWPDLETGNYNLAIWPEDLIYPSGPVESMVSSNLDLRIAPGIWRREFTTCYQSGRFFGHCAAIVNSNATAMTVQSGWLSQTYNHIVTLSGGDVLSGGRALTNATPFVPNSSTVPAGSAILLVQ